MANVGSINLPFSDLLGGFGFRQQGRLRWALGQGEGGGNGLPGGLTFCSLTGIPGYAARTCANMRRDRILEASFMRLSLFHAGVIALNVHGVSSLGVVPFFDTLGQLSWLLYQPIPNPSALRFPWPTYSISSCKPDRRYVHHPFRDAPFVTCCARITQDKFCVTYPGEQGAWDPKAVPEHHMIV